MAGELTQADLDAASLEIIGKVTERHGDPENGRHVLDVAARLLASARLAAGAGEREAAKLWCITLALGKSDERAMKWGSARRLVLAETIEEAALKAKGDVDADFDGKYHGPATHWGGTEVESGVFWLNARHKLHDDERDVMTPFAPAASPPPGTEENDG